jgi:hypothetical protein
MRERIHRRRRKEMKKMRFIDAANFEIAAIIKNNAREYDEGLINFDEFNRRQRATWDRVSLENRDTVLDILHGRIEVQA